MIVTDGMQLANARVTGGWSLITVNPAPLKRVKDPDIDINYH
ncbi:MAG: hypothetical protein WCA42_17340 [Desulfobacterales bacterium]